ncbi:phage tail terminator protein [Vreelandella venusta]|uniref:phage tail terminator protein n=1 Tax=Vreelandella venusta TaxID=44935 RepID=UPI0020100ECC|nr:hypothetical protein [Halomonas venusta]UQI42520.1 hypothetical protein M3L73_09750 [Halomonas venusta]
MADPDIIAALIQRITDECPGLALVDEAWFAEPLDNFDTQTPAVLVYLAKDDAKADSDTLRPVQPLRVTYGLWLVCKRDQFRPQRQALREALMGAMFNEEHNPMQYRGGETNDIRGELIWWREFWTIDTWLR